MARTTPLFRMTENAVGGNLYEYLSEARSNGNTWAFIARRLFTDYGLEVTDQTLRVWGRQLGVPDKPRAEAAS